MIRYVLPLLSIGLLIGCSEESTGDWYEVKYVDLYGSTESKLTDLSIVHKEGVQTAFDIEVLKDSSGTNVSFFFIDSCDMTYDGVAEIDDDTLRLSFFPTPEARASCDCRCDYKMIYTIKEDNWKGVSATYNQ